MSKKHLAVMALVAFAAIYASNRISFVRNIVGPTA